VSQEREAPSVEIAEALCRWLNLADQNWGINLKARHEWDAEDDLEDDCLVCEVFPTEIAGRNSESRTTDSIDYYVWVVLEQPYGGQENRIPKAWVNRRINLVEVLSDRTQNLELELPDERIALAIGTETALIDAELLRDFRTFRGAIRYTIRDYRRS
jgi:hypothetical protein